MDALTSAWFNAVYSPSSARCGHPLLSSYPHAHHDHTMTSLLPDTVKPATLLSRRFRFDQIPDLTGRVAIVTGGSGGIGYYTALPLAKAGATVVILSANEEKGKDAEAELNKQLKDLNSYGSVTWMGIDLGNLKAVDTLAKKLAGELERLDIFVANAGIGQAPYGITDDGLERHFEVRAFYSVLRGYVLSVILGQQLEPLCSHHASPPYHEEDRPDCAAHHRPHSHAVLRDAPLHT